MRTAAFETSAPFGGVALGDGERLLAEVRFDQPLIHARELVPALDRLVRQAGWRPTDLERLVVSIGPGSFTGLRIGLATAKVLACELDAQLIGVDSLDVLAADSPFDGPFAVLVDARRGSVYFRRYRSGGLPPAGEGPFETLSVEELRLEPGLPLLGSGAEVHAARWPGHPIASAVPRPATLLALATHGTSLDPFDAAPVYGMSGVRPPPG